ncbi:2272_t:CDS:2 [Funneliformis caledonium]|uniref:2272_t:CDS:1 n=1 Tax=Funneliformis caledonium TaxID=1117310 RepID=A0A9N8YXY1_9GLOM|nr:2272_t:CDS:2 [Funneliformis caledonium]
MIATHRSLHYSLRHSLHYSLLPPIDTSTSKTQTASRVSSRMPSPVPRRKSVDSTPDTDQMFIHDDETEYHCVQDDDNHGSSPIDTEFSSSQSSQKLIKSQEDNNPFLDKIT